MSPKILSRFGGASWPKKFTGRVVFKIGEYQKLDLKGEPYSVYGIIGASDEGATAVTAGELIEFSIPDDIPAINYIPDDFSFYILNGSGGLDGTGYCYLNAGVTNGGNTITTLRLRSDMFGSAKLIRGGFSIKGRIDKSSVGKTVSIDISFLVEELPEATHGFIVNEKTFAASTGRVDGTVWGAGSVEGDDALDFLVGKLDGWEENVPFLSEGGGATRT